MIVVDIERVRASAARAALNPAFWSEALWNVSQLIGSDMTLFEHVDKRTGTVEHGFNDRPDLVAATRAAYEGHFYRINPRYEVARSRPLHEVTHDDLLGDERTLSRHEFYADFLRPCGLRYFIGTAAADDAEQTVTFSLQRAADRGRIDADGHRLFAAILPDIRNALGMYLRLTHAPAGATLGAALDRLADPLGVVRADGRMVFANRAMAGLIAAGDILRLERDVLVGVDGGTNRAFADAMRRARASLRATMSGASAARGSGRLIVRVTPLDGDEAREFGPARERLFCVLIDDPARPHWQNIESAMRLFGLTRREATVGTHIAAGLTTAEIAQRLSVSRNTVRSHLAALREKLGQRSALAVAAEMRRAAGPLA